MKVMVRKSFVKDSQKLSSHDQIKLGELIERIAYFKTVFEIPQFKKMHGYKNAYRIKFGEYRIGFFRTNDGLELVRILLRKDIYRHFP